MVSKKIVLHFPPNLVDKPIIYKLSKEYGLEFNILKASVTPKEEGLLVLELRGNEGDYNSAIDYLKDEGVRVQPLSQDVTLNLDKCTHCGLCIPICPVSAFEKDPETFEIRFLKERCIACEFCVKVCPYDALEVDFNL
jgi:ferredoxin